MSQSCLNVQTVFIFKIFLQLQQCETNKQKLLNEILMFVLYVAVTCDISVTVTSPEPEPISSILSLSFQLMVGRIVLRAISVFKHLFILV